MSATKWHRDNIIKYTLWVIASCASWVLVIYIVEIPKDIAGVIGVLLGFVVSTIGLILWPMWSFK